MIALTMFAKCNTVLTHGREYDAMNFDAVPVHSVHVMFCCLNFQFELKYLLLSDFEFR